MTTCLESFKPIRPWHQAGLLLYDDDDNFIKYTNADGKLNADEFTLWISGPDQKAAARELFVKKDEDGLLAFKEFAYRPADEDFWNADKDGDDRLSPDEFKALRPAADAERPGAIFESIDTNGDGQICLAEFKTRAPRKKAAPK